MAGILARGTFDELMSTVEHVQLECKGGFYDTKSVKGKIELAKDISGLANSRGGYLLIGPATKRNPLYQGDEIVSVSQFTSSVFDADAYRDILRALVYPPISELTIEWHPGSADPSKGIASIYVPPSSASENPYLVSQIEVNSQVRGHIFGHFERVDDDGLPMTVQIMRDTMKDGKRYASLERRMETFEGLLAKLASTRPVKRNLMTSDHLVQRARDAKIATQLADVPSFFLLAAPTQPLRLTGLYSSRSAEH